MDLLVRKVDPYEIYAFFLLIELYFRRGCVRRIVLVENNFTCDIQDLYRQDIVGGGDGKSSFGDRIGKQFNTAFRLFGPQICIKTVFADTYGRSRVTVAINLGDQKEEDGG